MNYDNRKNKPIKSWKLHFREKMVFTTADANVQMHIGIECLQLYFSTAILQLHEHITISLIEHFIRHYRKPVACFLSV